MWMVAASGTAGGRWRRWLKTELDGVEWSVAYVLLGVTRHRSSQVALTSIAVTLHKMTVQLIISLILQASLFFSV